MRMCIEMRSTRLRLIYRFEDTAKLAMPRPYGSLGNRSSIEELLRSDFG